MNEIKLALIGKNISHSRSKVILEAYLQKKIKYDLIDCKSEKDLPSLVELSKKYHGVNITSPYKESYLDQVQISGAWSASINTILFTQKCPLAMSTDYPAIEKILKRLLEAGRAQTVRVLGSGNMARIVLEILTYLKVEFVSYSRRKKNIDLIDKETQEGDLVINCCAREYQYIPQNSCSYTFWDLNYSQDYEKYILEKNNIHFLDGGEMLELQAKYALSFWNLK